MNFKANKNILFLNQKIGGAGNFKANKNILFLNQKIGGAGV